MSYYHNMVPHFAIMVIACSVLAGLFFGIFVTALRHLSPTQQTTMGHAMLDMWATQKGTVMVFVVLAFIIGLFVAV